MSDGSSSFLSDCLGTLSQIAWLFAQLPQIWQNHRDQSVDGLALPFLMSWLLGDVTNLLGCLLTDQLPFQRNLAIYFTLVDLVLIYQYRRFSKTPQSGYQALGHHDAGGSVEDATPEERWRKHLRQVPVAHLDSPGGLAREYTRSMSRLGRKRQTSAQTATGVGRMDASFYSSKSDQATAPPGGHSAGKPDKSSAHENRGRSLARSHPARIAPLRTASLARVLPSTGRSTSDIINLTNPPKSPKALGASRFSTLPFLGIFTFLVFNLPTIYPSKSTSQFSRAWASSAGLTPLANPASTVRFRRSFTALDQQPMDWRRLIGRTSAWLCAILYLTSRLPQIWKNYRRKSVEGLSILLFIMAFLGNLTYVISMLTSPQMFHQQGYLAESFPYLLGSGGTLCFDFTIFIQSRLYPSDQHIQRRRQRAISASRDAEFDIEQQAALISPISPTSRPSLPTKSRSHNRSESTEMERPRSSPERRISLSHVDIQPESLRVDLRPSLVDSPTTAQTLL